jgi:hypothetical protein
MRKLLFLVDDRAPSFWELGDWPDASWPEEWVMQKTTWAALQQSEDPVKDLYESISTILENCSEKFFVVADSRFGNRHGGGRLLRELYNRWPNRFIRGVVYSSDPELPAGMPQSKFIKVSAGAQLGDSIAIRSFLEKGTAPRSLVQSLASKVLSMAIHDIEDLAYPLRLDAETLASEPEQFSIIRREYFEGATGYLGSESTTWSSREAIVSVGAVNLERRVIQVLEREVDGSSARSAVVCFHPEDQLRKHWNAASGYPPECTRLIQLLGRLRRTTASGGLSDSSTLKEALQEVIVQLAEITGSLRAALTEIRKEVPS